MSRDCLIALSKRIYPVLLLAGLALPAKCCAEEPPEERQATIQPQAPSPKELAKLAKLPQADWDDNFRPLSQLCRNNALDDLDARAAHYRRARFVFPSGEPSLNVLYAIINEHQPPEGLRRWLENWVKKHPQSATAKIAKARWHIQQGWQLRGAAVALLTTRKGQEGFQAHLVTAGKLLYEAAAIEKNDPAIYQHLIEVAKGLSIDPEDTYGMLRAGMEIDPAYYPLYVMMTEYLLPRWHGEPGEVEQWALETRRTLNQLQPELGDNALARIACRLLMYESHDYLMSGAIPVSRLNAAARAMFRRYPQSLVGRNFTALMACLTDDIETAQTLLAEVVQYQGGFEVWKGGDNLKKFQARFGTKATPGQEARVLQPFLAPVLNVRFRPGGDKLTLTSNGRYKVASIASQSFKSGGERAVKRMTQLLVTHDLSTAVATLADDDVVQLAHWDFADGMPGEVIAAGELIDAALLPDESGLVHANLTDTAHVYDFDSDSSTRSFAHGAPIRAVAISADGHDVATAADNGSIKIWDLKSGELKTTISIGDVKLQTLAFVPHSTRLAVTLLPHGLQLWDLGGKRVELSAAAEEVAVRATGPLAVSSDGKRLASVMLTRIGDEQPAVDDKLMRCTPRVLNLPALAWDDLRYGHLDQINDLEFSPDGQVLASASADKTVRLWEFTAGEVQQRVESAARQLAEDEAEAQKKLAMIEQKTPPRYSVDLETAHESMDRLSKAFARIPTPELDDFRPKNERDPEVRFDVLLAATDPKDSEKLKVGDEEPGDAPDTLDNTRHANLRLLRNRNFKELERLEAEALDNLGPDESFQWPLSNYYAQFDAIFTDRLNGKWANKSFYAWHIARPNSATPLIAAVRGELSQIDNKRFAWEPDLVADTHRELFRRKAEHISDLLNAAELIHPEHPELLRLRLKCLLLADTEHGLMEDFYQRAIKVAPRYLPLHELWALYLSRSESSRVSELPKFALKVTEEFGGDVGLYAYARLANIAIRDGKRRVVLGNPFAQEKLSQAAAVLLKACPDDPYWRQFAAYLALSGKNREVLLAALDVPLDGEVTNQVWQRGIVGLEAARKWARAPIAEGQAVDVIAIGDNQASFVGDENTLAVITGGERPLGLFDLRTKTITSTPPFTISGSPAGFLVEPSGRFIVVPRSRFWLKPGGPKKTGDRLLLWNLQANNEAAAIDEVDVPSPRPTAMALSKDNGMIAVGSEQGGIYLWRFESRQRQELAKVNEPVFCLTFSPNGAWLAAGQKRGFTIWEVATGKLMHRGENEVSCWTKSMRFLADGTTLLVDYQIRGSVETWKVTADNLQLKQNFVPSRENQLVDPSTSQISFDGKLFATSHNVNVNDVNRPRIHLWDLSSRKQLGTFEGHWDQVNSLSFSPNGKRLASSSSDGTIQIWDLQQFTKAP